MPDLIRLTRGCYVPPEHAADLAASCAALLSIAPPHTVVVGVTAARLHQLWLPEVRAKPQLATRTPGRVAKAMTRPRRTELQTHRRDIPDQDIVIVDGLPMTSLARTWWDLAAALSLPDLVAAGDKVLRSGVSLDELVELRVRLRGRRGVRLATQALGLLDARSRSHPESHLRVAVALGGLPPFEVNEAITDEHGQWLAEPDLSCSEARIALEYQGADHAEIRQMRRDITRHGDLRKAGWVALLYGPAEVFGRPWQIAPELRQLIAVRAPQLFRIQP